LDNPAEKKQVVAQCCHCGNKGPMQIVFTHTAVFGGRAADSPETRQDVESAYMWELLRCPVCGMLSLRRYRTVPKPGTAEMVSEQKMLYPDIEFERDEVPPGVRSAFEAALRVRGADPEVCLLSLRQTLKAICRDRGAKGKKLKAQVKDLCRKRILPESARKVLWVLSRLRRETAGHTGGAAKRGSPAELESILEYIQALIVSVYLLDARGKQIKNDYRLRREQTEQAHQL